MCSPLTNLSPLCLYASPYTINDKEGANSSNWLCDTEKKSKYYNMIRNLSLKNLSFFHS